MNWTFEWVNIITYNEWWFGTFKTLWAVVIFSCACIQTFLIRRVSKYTLTHTHPLANLILTFTHNWKLWEWQSVFMYFLKPIYIYLLRLLFAAFSHPLLVLCLILLKMHPLKLSFEDHLCHSRSTRLWPSSEIIWRTQEWTLPRLTCSPSLFCESKATQSNSITYLLILAN